MDRADSIVGLAVSMTLPRTDGSITFEVYRNNVATGVQVIISTGNTTQTGVTTQAAALDTFVSGDRIGVRVTTNDISSNSIDVEAAVTVKYD